MIEKWFRVVFVKHQVQTINGTEYEYWYLYESYYDPSMDNPTNFKVGKVGDDVSSLVSNLRDKAGSKDLDISADEIEKFRNQVESVEEQAEEKDLEGDEKGEFYEKIFGSEEDEEGSDDYPEEYDIFEGIGDVESWSRESKLTQQADNYWKNGIIEHGSGDSISVEKSEGDGFNLVYHSGKELSGSRIMLEGTSKDKAGSLAVEFAEDHPEGAGDAPLEGLVAWFRSGGDKDIQEKEDDSERISEINHTSYGDWSPYASSAWDLNIPDDAREDLSNDSYDKVIGEDYNLIAEDNGFYVQFTPDKVTDTPTEASTTNIKFFEKEFSNDYSKKEVLEKAVEFMEEHPSIYDVRPLVDEYLEEEYGEGLEDLEESEEEEEEDVSEESEDKDVSESRKLEMLKDALDNERVQEFGKVANLGDINKAVEEDWSDERLKDRFLGDDMPDTGTEEPFVAFADPSMVSLMIYKPGGVTKSNADNLDYQYKADYVMPYVDRGGDVNYWIADPSELSDADDTVDAEKKSLFSKDWVDRMNDIYKDTKIKVYGGTDFPMLVIPKGQNTKTAMVIAPRIEEA